MKTHALLVISLVLRIQFKEGGCISLYSKLYIDHTVLHNNLI